MTFMKCLCAFLLVTASPLFAQQPSLESAERVQNLSAPKLVGYFPQWGVYNGTFGHGGYFAKNVITSGSASRVHPRHSRLLASVGCLQRYFWARRLFRQERNHQRLRVALDPSQLRLRQRGQQSVRELRYLRRLPVRFHRR